MNIDFWNETTGWAVSWDGTVLHTEDGGSTWEVQETGTLNPFYSIVSLDENSAIAGGLGCLYITRDDGDTWQNSDFGGTGNLVWKNLIATKTGETKPDEIIIAIAHFDSISAIPWERAPGADDNASGTTALLAMAEVLKDISTKRTVKFIFASGEEQGLRGSRAYAEWARENNLNIIAVLNMDMIAYLDEEIHDLQIRKNSFSEWLSDYIIRVEELYNIGLTLYPSEQGSGGSDHIPFWEQGYSALCSIEYPGDHWYPYYHTTEDLIEHLFMDYQAEVTQLNLATLLSLAEIKGLKDFYQKENPFTYPNPFRASMPAQGITFANLDGFNTLKIYTISGKKIIEKDINGEISYIWDLTTQDGEITPSGVYLWVLEGEQKDFSGKLAIIR
jgi:hypothetical protein